MKLMKWLNILYMASARERINIMNKVVEAVKIFKKGKPSKEGDYYHDLITSDKVEIIGFVPEVTYLRVNSDDKSDLEALFSHPSSIPTLLYYVKDSPFMLLVNPNMSYNYSKLLEIKENSSVVEIKNLKGIIG